MSTDEGIKNSVKATSLFGGVQAFSMLVTMIRSKIVALLIGPAGIGLVELYQSTIRLIGSLTDFHLHTSAVRDVSMAYKSGDTERFIHVSSLFSRIVWITGLLGAFVCLLGSPLWSKLSFGNYDYTIGFAILSCVLLLNQLTNGKTVLLQSTRHFRYIAYSGIIGNVLGLVTTIPIYYFFGVDGIVAVIILAAVFSYLLAWFYSSKLKIEYESIGFKDVLKEGKGMLQQGFLLSINYLLSTLIFYILRIVISNHGGTEELGLYSASFAVVTVYIGLIVQSMSKEYYPRISALSTSNKEFNDAVDKQMNLSLLLLGPMIVCFLSFSEQLLILLYSEKFVGATMFMSLSMLGVILQAPSWCLGYAYLAKGDNKAFLLYETIAKVEKLTTDILFYYLWGLTGIGISFILSYLYYLLQSAIVCKKRYGLVLSHKTISALLLYLIICITVFITTVIDLSFLYRVIIDGTIIIISCIISYKRLDGMIDITSFIKSKLHKK